MSFSVNTNTGAMVALQYLTQTQGQLDQTQSAIVLESLINKLFASFASKVGDSQSQPADTPKADAPKKEESKK